VAFGQPKSFLKGALNSSSEREKEKDTKMVPHSSEGAWINASKYSKKKRGAGGTIKTE